MTRRQVFVMWCVAAVAAIGWLLSSSLALAQEAPAAAGAAVSPWVERLTSTGGRIALAASVYAIVALSKLLPLKAASPAAKLTSVLALALGAGAGAWGAGASLWESIGTLLAAALGAIGLHELGGKVAAALIPIVAAVPRVGPAIASVLRALMAPSSPPVDALVAERELEKVGQP